MGTPHNVAMADPIYLTELVEQFGTAKVAQMMGYSQAAIAAAVRSGTCRFSLERLAELLVQEKEPTPKTVVLCQVPSAQKPAFDSFVEALKIDTTVITL